MSFQEFVSIVLVLHCGNLSNEHIEAAWIANVPPEHVGEFLDHPERFS